MRNSLKLWFLIGRLRTGNLKIGCSVKVKRKGYLNFDRDTLFFFEQLAVDLFQPPTFK